MQLRTRRFQQIDVFTGTPYLGNPVAVVLDGDDIADADMLRFARWTNLTETTFVLPPTDSAADYRMRIFTPTRELPFAGHPTLGTCHAWLRSGGKPKSMTHVTQQTEMGLVSIRHDGERLSFATPSLKRTASCPKELARIAAALGIETWQIRGAQMLDNGPVWLGLLLDSEETVLALRPDHHALKEFKQSVGAIAIREELDANGPRLGLTVRAFAASIGIEEDPVTGSLNGSAAQWLIGDGLISGNYVARQGQCLGRDGHIHVERDPAGQIWIGGESVSCIEGTVNL